MEDPPMQSRLGWEDAAAVICAAAESHRRARVGGAIVVGITGPVGAGKSTLASRLSGAVISTDSYLPDYDGVPQDQRDRPESADLARLAVDLAALRAGRAADIPIWSFQSHRREGLRRLEPSALVVVEGIHALHALARPHLDVRVFVDAPADVRWARWEGLEASGQRGWGVEPARAYFHSVAEPTFAERHAEYRASAHYIVINDSGAGPPAPAD